MSFAEMLSQGHGRWFIIAMSHKPCQACFDRQKSKAPVVLSWVLRRLFGALSLWVLRLPNDGQPHDSLSRRLGNRSTTLEIPLSDRYI